MARKKKADAPDPTPPPAQPSALPIVRCAFTDLVDPAALKPHPDNPNRHSAKQLETYRSIVQFQGFRRPITVSKRSGFITRGHGLYQVALMAGWSPVPVDFQDYDSRDAEIADLIADNQLQRMSEMDNAKLQELVVLLSHGEMPVTLTALPTDELEELLAGGSGAPDPQAPQPPDTPKEPPQAPEPGQVQSSSSSPPNVVQMFLTDAALIEFKTITAFFKKELAVENTTDCVMEILRSAFRSHTEVDEAAPPT